MNKPILLDNTEVSQLSDLLKRNQISYDDVLWDMFRRPRRQGDFIWEQAALSGAALKAMLGPGAKLSGLHDLVCLSILIGIAQTRAMFCILDISYLLLLGNPESQACTDLAAANNSDKPLTFFCVPDILASPAVASFVLPDDVKLICSLASGTDDSVRPHNAVLSYWKQRDGVSKDVAWHDVGRMLQQHDSFMSARTDALAVSHSDLLKAAEADRDAAVARADRMHADLQSATATLQYMERLLRALKLQKKATEAAEESLARVTEEAAELNKQLAQMRSLYEAGLVATQNRDDAIARLEGHMLEIWPLQKAHTALVVRHLVEAAMGRVKSRALTEAERSIAGLKKGMRAALGKLNKAREEAAEVRKESEARLEVAVALRGAKEAVVKDFLAQRRVEAELRDALERMGRLLEGERRLVAEIKAERRQAEGQHQQACEDLEAAVSKAADRFARLQQEHVELQKVHEADSNRFDVLAQEQAAFVNGVRAQLEGFEQGASAMTMRVEQMQATKLEQAIAYINANPGATLDLCGRRAFCSPDATPSQLCVTSTSGSIRNGVLSLPGHLGLSVEANCSLNLQNILIETCVIESSDNAQAPSLLSVAPRARVSFSRGAIESSRTVACEVHARGGFVASDIHITGCSHAAVSCRGGTVDLDRARIAGNACGVVSSGSSTVKLASCRFSQNSQSNLEAVGSCRMEVLDSVLDCAQGVRSIVASQASQVACTRVELLGMGGGEALMISGEAAVVSMSDCTFCGVRVACSVSRGARLKLVDCVLAHCGGSPRAGHPEGAVDIHYGGNVNGLNVTTPTTSVDVNGVRSDAPLANAITNSSSGKLESNAQHNLVGPGMSTDQNLRTDAIATPDQASFRLQGPFTGDNGNDGTGENFFTGNDVGQSVCAGSRTLEAPEQNPDKEGQATIVANPLQTCVLVTDKGSVAALKSCRFISNLGNSASAFGASTLRINDCTVFGGGPSFCASGNGTLLELRSTTVHGAADAAVELAQGATGDISGLHVEACAAAVHVASAASTTIVDSAVVRCKHGMQVRSAAQVTVSRVSWDTSLESSAAVGGRGSQLTLEKCTLAGSEGGHLKCDSQATLVITGSHIFGSLKSAMQVTGEATTVQASDTFFRSVGGSVLQISDAAAGVLQRCVVEDCCDAVTAAGTDTKVALDDCSATRCGTVAAATSAASVNFTRTKCRDVQFTALTADSGGTLAAISFSIEQCGQSFIAVNGAGSATIEDTSLTSCVGTGVLADGTQALIRCLRCTIVSASGGALWCRGGAVASCRDVSVRRCDSWGMRASGPSTELTAVKCTVRETGFSALVAEQSAKLAVAECEVDGTDHGFALSVDTEASVTLSASTFSNSHASVCSVRGSGSVMVKGSTLKGSAAGSGVQLCEGGAFEGENVEIFEHREHGVIQIGTSGVFLKESCVQQNVRGAGVVVVGAGARCSLSNCKVHSNTTGAAIALDGGSIEAKMSQFCESTAGLGVLAAGRGTTAKLEMSTAIGNCLGGIVICDAASAELQRFTACYCKGYGVEAHGTETFVDIYAATIKYNSKAGVHACDAAQVRLRAGTVVQDNNDNRAQVIVTAQPSMAGKASLVVEGRNTLGKVVQAAPNQV